MADIASIVAAMRRAPTNVRFADMRKVCEHYFGQPRQSGTSHAVFRTPWRGDPRVNTSPITARPRRTRFGKY